jgi:hypothetical protein
MGKEEFRGMEELGMCQHMDTSTWLQGEREKDGGSE